jgi:hypothetical protein
MKVRFISLSFSTSTICAHGVGVVDLQPYHNQQA